MTVTRGASRHFSPKVIRPLELPAQIVEYSPMCVPAPIVMRSALRKDTFGANVTSATAVQFAHLRHVRIPVEVQHPQSVEVDARVDHRQQRA